jgi:tetratricopeptide (TPR) repeat protein
VSNSNGPSDDDLAEADLAEAHAFHAARNHAAALRAANRALARNPVGRHAFDALVVVAEVAYARSAYVRQAEIAGELLSRNPDRIEGYLHLAYAHTHAGDDARAAKAIAAGLARFPNSSRLAQQEARRLAARGDHKAAISWAEKAVLQEPTSAAHLATLASCLSDAGRERAARSKIVEALALDPQSAYVQVLAAVIAHNQNRWEDCGFHAVQAVRLNPGDTDAHRLAVMARRFRHPLLKLYWRTFPPVAPYIIRHMPLLLFALLVVHAFFATLGALYLVPVLVVYYLSCGVMVSVAKRRVRPPQPPQLKNY